MTSVDYSRRLATGGGNIMADLISTVQNRNLIAADLAAKKRKDAAEKARLGTAATKQTQMTVKKPKPAPDPEPKGDEPEL